MVVSLFVVVVLVLVAVRRGAYGLHDWGVQVVVRVVVAQHRPVSSPEVAHGKHRTQPCCATPAGPFQ